MTAQADAFNERARKRLQVYSLAKEIYLSQKYLKLESALIDKAHDILENSGELGPFGIKQLSALYKDMLSKSASATVTAGMDESGMPTVTYRDLTGL